MNRTQWLICIIASIGFAFDTYELLMLPLIIKPALLSLGGLVAGTPEYTNWARILFFVPAIAGGVFGLLGGWLTDRLGRRRVLTWSILIYAFGAFAAGYSTNLPQLLVCRCFVFVGVCVEFVAAVAWLAEIFPEPKQREKVLGFTQAFASVGGLMVAGVFAWCVQNTTSLPSIYGANEAWRYTLISGLIPAIPLIVIRPFLPESPAWQAKKDAGTLRRPSLKELFSPALIRTTLVTTALFACCYGIAYGAIQHLPQMVPGLIDVKTAVVAAQEGVVKKAALEKPGVSPAPKELAMAKAKIEQAASASVQTWQELGGLLGRVILAIAALYIVSRRLLLRVFVVPAVIVIPGLFWWLSNHFGSPGSLELTKWAIFTVGLLVVAQFSFWGNHIPRVFPMHLRGTGESFAANIGGRVIGTSMAWIFFTFSAATPPNPSKMALTAATIALILTALGFILTFFMPEPLKEDDGH